MEQEKAKCPICEWNKEVHAEEPVTRTLEVTCSRCGQYAITFEALLSLRSISQEKRAILSGAIREANALGRERLTIKKDSLDGILATSIPNTVPEKADRLLLNLSRAYKAAGEIFHLYPDRDMALGYCQRKEELTYLTEILLQEEFLEAPGGQPGRYRLTLAGWIRIGEMQQSGAASDIAFIAMSFRPEWDLAWKEGIKSAIEEDCGYKALRMDALEHTENINDRIIAEMRRSKFMVADFSANPGGVYLEAGFELGLGRPVIWTCIDREDKIKALHFDINHYNFIFWKNPPDLRLRLRDRILAIIGEGTQISQSPR